MQGYLKTVWKDWEHSRGMLASYAVAVLKAMPLPQIKRSDFVAVLDPLADRPAVARLMHATLRNLFKWAADRGDLERSPIESLKAPVAPASRDRVLHDDEHGIIWQVSHAIRYPFGPMYRLLIATGQRREEVAALDWSELHEASATCTLPAGCAKNVEANIVPLNALAVAELDELPKRNIDRESDASGPAGWPGRGLVFTTTGKTVVSGFSKGRARSDDEVAAIIAKQASAAGHEPHNLPAWRVHDFPRMVATGLQRLGICFEVTEAVLNHVSGSRSGWVYQRRDWKEEKPTALDAWRRHVAALLVPVSATNIVSMSVRNVA